MIARKERLTVTVDADVLDAGNRAVAAGVAPSLSAWVNEALWARSTQDRRLQALGEAIAQYESERGEITPEEMAAQQRGDREAAVVVRGPGRQPSSQTGRRGRSGASWP